MEASGAPVRSTRGCDANNRNKDHVTGETIAPIPTPIGKSTDGNRRANDWLVDADMFYKRKPPSDDDNGAWTAGPLFRWTARMGKFLYCEWPIKEAIMSLETYRSQWKGGDLWKLPWRKFDGPSQTLIKVRHKAGRVKCRLPLAESMAELSSSLHGQKLRIFFPTPFQKIGLSWWILFSEAGQHR